MNARRQGISARLALLDHQLPDADGLPVGRVDDVELSVPTSGAPPEVEAVLTGAEALGQRLGGLTGAVMAGRRESAAADDGDGTSLGPVRDVRLAERQPGGAGARFRVSGLVIGGGFLARPAHAWGSAEGRASGPWLLRLLTSRAVRQARFIPADRAADWGRGVVRVTGQHADFPRLTEAVGR